MRAEANWEKAMHMGLWFVCRGIREGKGRQLGLAWGLQAGLLAVRPLDLIFVSWCWALIWAKWKRPNGPRLVQMGLRPNQKKNNNNKKKYKYK